jgi:hypothetical protein
MTMGLAVIPASVDGVVVMADSMGLQLSPDGRELRLPGSGKVGFIPSARMAFMVSGYMGATLDELVALRSETEFENAAPSLFFSALALYKKSDLPREVLDGRSPQVLAAGFKDGVAIAALLEEKGIHLTGGGPAMYSVGGVFEQWLRGPLRELELTVPSTLREAHDLVLTIARKFFASIFNPDISPVALPLTVATITADEVAFEEVTHW